MTKQAKSLRKGKFKPSRAPVAKASLAKGRRVKGKPPRRDPLDSFVDAAAHALDLKLEPAWKSAVKTNLEVTLALAALFADFPLPDEAEPAPVFSA
jgi:1-carboxybiuret hydrolase subunit AtzG-like protein